MIKMTQKFMDDMILVTIEGGHWEVEHPLLHYKCTGTIPYSKVMDTVERLKRCIKEKLNEDEYDEKAVCAELTRNGFTLVDDDQAPPFDAEKTIRPITEGMDPIDGKNFTTGSEG